MRSKYLKYYLTKLLTLPLFKLTETKLQQEDSLSFNLKHLLPRELRLALVERFSKEYSYSKLEQLDTLICYPIDLKVSRQAQIHQHL